MKVADDAGDNRERDAALVLSHDRDHSADSKSSAVDERGKASPRPATQSKSFHPSSQRRRSPYARRRPVYAALDLGTNNCRLLIAEPVYHGFRVVDAFSRIVRLGEGLGTGHQLSEPAIERALEAIRICKAKIDDHDAVRTRLIATEACRVAQNGSAFIQRALEEAHVQLEVIDRKTEAYLAVTGCASLADPFAEGVVIFDIGGGSTEIAWLDALPRERDPSAFRSPLLLHDPTTRIRAWASLPAGVVTLAERHGGYDVTPDHFEGMVDEVTGLLENFIDQCGPAPRRDRFHLLGTSGTVTTIGGLHLRLPRYDRRRVDGLWMNHAQVTRVMEDLLSSAYKDRAANPCIGTERADLVLAGCAILEAIRRAFPSPRLRIADRGLREGMLMTMMREDGVWARYHQE